MKKQARTIVKIVACTLALILVVLAIRSVQEKKHAWRDQSERIAEYEDESRDRVAKSVITLPEESIVVGIVNGTGTYISKLQKKEGAITVKNEFLKTQFTIGEFEKKDPRQDAVVPVYISTDSHGGSMYVMLFYDRGDVAIEKSYARLGGSDIIIDDLRMLQVLPENKDKQEYQVDVFYHTTTNDKKQKEVIIPVIDGHFDPDGTITR